MLGSRPGARMLNGSGDGKRMGRNASLEAPGHEVVVADPNFRARACHPQPEITPLEGINDQLKQADDELARLVKDDAVVRRLAGAPGVGPVTASLLRRRTRRGGALRLRRSGESLPRPRAGRIWLRRTKAARGHGRSRAEPGAPPTGRGGLFNRSN